MSKVLAWAVDRHHSMLTGFVSVYLVSHLCGTTAFAVEESDPARQAYVVIQAEKKRLCEQRGATHRASIEKAIEDRIAAGRGDLAALRMLAAVLRVCNQQAASGSPQPGDRLQVLASRLSQQLADVFVSSPVSASDRNRLVAMELEKFRKASRLDILSPYAYAPSDAAAFERLRDELDAGVAAIRAKSNQAILLTDNFSAEKLQVLWRRFYVEIGRKLIVDVLTQQVDQQIAAQLRELFGELPVPVRPTAQPSSLVPAEDLPDHLLGVARISHERTMAILLGILPMLTLPQLQAANSNEFQVFDFRSELKNSFEPQTALRFSSRGIVNRDWLLVAFAIIESSDGKTLQEELFAQKCFVFDRRNQRLRVVNLLDSITLESLEASSPAGRSKLHMHQSYDYGDVLDVFCWCDGLGRQLRSNHSPEEALRIPDLVGVALSIDHQSTGDNLILGATNAAMVGGRHRLSSIPKSIVLPELGVRTHITLDSGHPNIPDVRFPVKWTVFPSGIKLQFTTRAAQVSTGTPSYVLTNVVAPGRIAGQTGVIRTFLAQGPQFDSSEDTLCAAIEKLCGEIPEIAAKRLIMRYLKQNQSMAAGGDSAADSLAFHLQLLRLERRSADLSQPCCFDLRDLKIGILHRLGRFDEAYELLGGQLDQLEHSPDHEFRDRYAGFYSNHWNAGREEGAVGPGNYRRANHAEFHSYLEWQEHYNRIVSEVADSHRLNTKARLEMHTPSEERSVQIDGLIASWIDAAEFNERRRNILRGLIDAIWATDTGLGSTSHSTLETIEHHWRTSIENMSKLETDYEFTSDAYLLQWEIWHGLSASRRVTPPEESERKGKQTSLLLAELDAIVPRLASDSGLGTSVVASASQEVLVARDRLRRFFDSPLNPLGFEPVSDKQFSEALRLIRERLSEDITQLQNSCRTERKKRAGMLLEDVSRDRVQLSSFFHDNYYRWASVRARFLVSHTAGNILRQYCVSQRQVRLDDKSLFPFAVPKGFHLTYRMNAGISFFLVAPYLELDQSDADLGVLSTRLEPRAALIIEGAK